MAIRKTMSKKQTEPKKTSPSASQKYPLKNAPNYVEKKSGNRSYNTSNPLGGITKPKLSYKKTKSNLNDGGTYFTTDTGRISRTYGKYSPIESMDTTGYGKGKKEFDVTKSYSGGYKSSSKINRGQVPSKIQEMKKGATRNVSFKNGVMIENKKKK